MSDLLLQVWTKAYSRVLALREEDGQTLVEYALIIALVSVALVGALTALKGNINSVFTAIGTALTGAVSGG